MCSVIPLCILPVSFDLSFGQLARQRQAGSTHSASGLTEVEGAVSVSVCNCMCVCVCCDLALNLLQQSGRKNDRENTGKLKQLHSLHNFCKQSSNEMATKTEGERHRKRVGKKERAARAAKKRAKVRIKPRALRP